MDYREAISILKTWRVTGDKEHEALDMAIFALQAQEIRDLLIVSPLLDKKKKKRKREAISALQEQEELYVDSKCKTCRYYHDYDDVRCMICDDENDMYEEQEVKKSRCTYKPDCPWYDGSKCNSPNDHGYHECDYDRGIFPESYEEEIKN